MMSAKTRLKQHSWCDSQLVAKWEILEHYTLKYNVVPHLFHVQ